MKHQLYFLAITLSLAGCAKDKIVPQHASGPKLMSVKAQTDGKEMIQEEYRYDENGNIKTRTTYKDYAAGLISTKTTYTYDEGRLVQKDGQTDISGSTAASQYVYSRSTFEYSGDRIIQQNHYLNTDNHYELRSFTVYTYDHKDHPVKQTQYSPDGALVRYTLLTFEDDNVVASEEYVQKTGHPEAMLSLKRHYRHDSKKNPYRQVYHSVENIPFSINHNNITAVITINYNRSSDSAPDTTVTAHTNYAYNNPGYPALMNENGNEFVLQYQ